MAERLTLEQKADKLYTWIHNYLQKKAKSPSHREMAQGLRYSTATIAECLTNLEARGKAIHRIRGRHRQVWVPLNQQPEED